jgi:hypothetical protein
MPLLQDVVVTFLRSIVVLAVNGQFLSCVAIVFSEPCEILKINVFVFH